MIDGRNASALEQVAPRLAQIYKYDFAREPWNERSRCADELCATGYCANEPGEACGTCGRPLVDAYDDDTLIRGWQELVTQEDAMMEIALDDAGEPLRATIARPTTPDELYARKYARLEEMEPWLAETLPGELIWIEDTFADLTKNTRGNLRTRARTLGRIATRYGGLLVATRTLAPSIVRATQRDLPEQTTLYLGRASEDIRQVVTAGSYAEVPDERTFITVDMKGDAR